MHLLLSLFVTLSACGHAHLGEAHCAAFFLSSSLAILPPHLELLIRLLRLQEAGEVLFTNRQSQSVFKGSSLSASAQDLDKWIFIQNYLDKTCSLLLSFSYEILVFLVSRTWWSDRDLWAKAWPDLEIKPVLQACLRRSCIVQGMCLTNNKVALIIR